MPAACSHTHAAVHLPEQDGSPGTEALPRRKLVGRFRGSGFGNRPRPLGRRVPLPVLLFSSYKINCKEGTSSGGKREWAGIRHLPGSRAVQGPRSVAKTKEEGEGCVLVRVLESRIGYERAGEGSAPEAAAAACSPPTPTPVWAPHRLPLLPGRSSWGGCWERRRPPGGDLCHEPSSPPHPALTQEQDPISP